MTMRSLKLFSLSVLVLALSGCIFSPDEKPPEPPAPIPPNDTPQNTVQRFIRVYEEKKTVEYEELFTGDFTFEFSNADPELQQEWQTGWFREDERLAARNLFNGGVNMDGQTVSPATSIQLDLSNKNPADDNSGGRDPETNKVLVALVTMSVELSNGDVLEVGGANPARHRFFLVRGDQAIDLDAGQPADDRHWYIRRWIDETQPTSAPRGGLGTTGEGDGRTVQTRTWGEIKAGAR